MIDRIKYTQIPVILILVILVMAVLKITSGIVLPLVVAFFLAGLFTPFTRMCNRHNIPKWLAIIFVFLIILGAFFLIVLFLENSAYSIMRELPKYSKGFSDFAVSVDAYLIERLGFESPVLAELNWQQPVMNIAGNLSSYTVSFVSTAGITFLLMVFILVEQQDLLRKLHHAFPSTGVHIASIFGQIGQRISTYLWIKSILSGVTGVLVYVIARLVGLDFALIWGVLTFLFNFIPSIGSILISVAVVLMACVQFFPHLDKILIVAVSVTSVQMIIGNFLDPKIQGDRLNLSPFVLIVSLMFWGYLWGIVGMFLAVPIMAVFQIVCDTIPGLKPVAIMISGQRRLNMMDEQEHVKEEALGAEFAVGDDDIEGSTVEEPLQADGAKPPTVNADATDSDKPGGAV